MKQCAKCKDSKDLSEFNISPKAKDGRHSYCRDCHKQHYKDNSVRHKANATKRNKRISEELRVKLWQWYLDHPCTDCGNTNPIVLQADHVRGTKISTVSTLLSTRRPWSELEDELAKCESRCANCHMIKTARDFGWYKVQQANVA